MFKKKKMKNRRIAGLENTKIRVCLKELESGNIGGFAARWLRLPNVRRELYVYAFYAVNLALLCGATYLIEDPVGVLPTAAMAYGAILFISFLSMEARAGEYRDLLSRLICEGVYAELKKREENDREILADDRPEENLRSAGSEPRNSKEDGEHESV